MYVRVCVDKILSDCFDMLASCDLGEKEDRAIE